MVRYCFNQSLPVVRNPQRKWCQPNDSLPLRLFVRALIYLTLDYVHETNTRQGTQGTSLLTNLIPPVHAAHILVVKHYYCCSYLGLVVESTLSETRRNQITPHATHDAKHQVAPKRPATAPCPLALCCKWLQDGSLPFPFSLTQYSKFPFQTENSHEF